MRSKPDEEELSIIFLSFVGPAKYKKLLSAHDKYQYLKTHKVLNLKWCRHS